MSNKEFQPILWIVRDDSFADTSIVMPEDGWLDTQGYKNLHLRTHIMFMSTGTHYLYTETCDVRDGTWERISRYSSSSDFGTPADEFFTSDRPKSEFQRLRRFIRWRWTDFASSTSYQLCFRMQATLKR